MLSGIDRIHMDHDVRPQDDLFTHVNGTWLASAEIPQDRSRYGAFDVLRENAEENVRDLIEEAASKEPPLDSPEGKVGGLFASFMDTQLIDALGASPLVKDLVEVAGVTSARDVCRVSGALQRTGAQGLTHLWVTADAGSPEDYIVYLHQAGLGLPDEAYYREEEHAQARSAYQDYLVTMLKLATPALAEAGLDLGEDPAERVYALEERIASHHWDRVATRDAIKAYTKMSAAELAEATPGWDWAAWADGLGAPEHALDHVVARQPDVLSAVGVALQEVPIEDWQAWLAVRLLEARAPYLSDDFVNANFDFRGKALSGTPQIRERWKRGVALVESFLGEAAGQLYVAKHYPPQAHERMQALVENVIEAFRRRITELEWMGPQTRQEALQKLEAFRPKIGHPPTWRDYSAYVIDPADLVGNVRRGNAFESDRDLAKIGQPIDRDEWLMTPQTVNAYYHPMLNEIVFPAAILQPPFFTVDADDAVNYGGIGGVIAHEIGHGFDDQGSRFAGDGSLTDWWTEQDRTAFDDRAQRLIAQFDALTPREAPDHTVNGGMTVGENIGDLCGLELALSAYRISHGGEAPEIDGWTGEQRFFLGWAQVWRGTARVEEAKRLIAVDPHAPADLRGNTVRNVDAFHLAFASEPGDGMWLDPQERVRIF
ncbi:MAG: M13-type metalloendopeptidase [Ornithinimicrobium sp.]